MVMYMINPNKVYYLASPYSHKNKGEVYRRYREQQRLHAALIQKYNALIIAPIEMCHMLSERFHMPTGYEYWKNRDRTLIEHSDGIIVCLMEGWKESVGVTDEIQHAKSLGKELLYLNPTTLQLHTTPNIGVNNEKI